MNGDVICQALHSLTVAICKSDDHTIVGTGFIVSRNPGLILTCAHIIEDICQQRRRIGLKVTVYFRNYPKGQEYQEATVVGCLPDFDDDIALLKLDHGITSLPEDILELGTVDPDQYRDFMSYGYGSTNKDAYISAPIEGRILGFVETNKLNLHKDRIYLSTKTSILDGHSGSPILDQKINRIVGIIIDSNGTNAGHATDCAILKLEALNTFNLLFSDEPVPKSKARMPRLGVLETIKEDFSVNIDSSFGIPEPTYEASEWTGRSQRLEDITNDWNHEAKRITALVGFGGEGKSSLVRRWLDSASNLKVFWWSFYKNSDIDAFFEKCFQYISNGMYINAKKETRAEKLAAFLYTSKFLFILDGFEVMQHSNLSNYGEVINESLLLFLEYFAAPYHESHCIITSRLPLCIGNYTTITQYHVDRLSREDGCTLLRNLGVKDVDTKLETVVQAWDGHALALTLVGTYLREKHGGKIIRDLTIYTKDFHGNERRRDQVARMLNRYENNLLNKVEQLFLLIFCVFRHPVTGDAISAIMSVLENTEANATSDRLIKYKILRFDGNTQEYSIHPLIRDYYRNSLVDDQANCIFAHYIVINYYARQIPQELNDNFVSISKLNPVVETIIHLCSIGHYDLAYSRYLTSIYIQSESKFRQGGYLISDLLIHWLGAYNVANDLLKSFFSEKDTDNELHLQEVKSRSVIFDHLGQCSMYLGELDKAIQYYRKAIIGYKEDGDWIRVARVHRHLALLFIQQGDLKQALQEAERAFDLAETSEDVQKLFPEDSFQLSNSEIYENFSPENTILAAALLGYIDALRGETDLYFAYTLDLCSDITLYKETCLWYATYLVRINSHNEAGLLLKLYIEKETYPAGRSRCNNIMANIAMKNSDYALAKELLDRAVENGRESSRHDVLIEALISRGKCLMRQSSFKAAKEDLDEALSYSKNEYRLYEADNRIGLAWLYYLQGDQQAARKEAKEGELISIDIGYSWAYHDAQEILTLINST